MPDLDQLKVLAVWEICTQHITEEDMKTMHGCPDLVLVEYPEGWWICVPPTDEPAERATWREKIGPSGYGLSDAFIQILEIAWHHDIYWIRLDCDGPDYDFLETFEW